MVDVPWGTIRSFHLRLKGTGCDGIMTLPQHHKIAAISVNRGDEDQPAEVIHCNTEVL